MNHFICGSGAFYQEEEDLWTLSSSPRKSTRKFCKCRSNKKSSNNSNPYSTRGLDKFTKVQSDLEKKRQMIYDQMDMQDISLIRFGYSSSDGGWVPIVVKYKNQEQFKPNNTIKESAVLEKLEPLEKTEEIQSLKSSSNEKTKKIGLLSSSADFVKMRCHSYWVMVLVMILVCLVIYGRSFAIICTSIWWYLVPNMKAGELNLRRLSMKKKDFKYNKEDE